MLASAFCGHGTFFYSAAMTLIVGKHPELMAAAAAHADAFAPQIYWFGYPDPGMLEPDNLPPNPTSPYKKCNPASYADLCLDWWRSTVGIEKPLILTGQAFWQTGISERWKEFRQPQAEAKLDQFLAEFTGWSRVAGINWWHFGHERVTADDGAMTPRMSDAIAHARLGERAYCHFP